MIVIALILNAAVLVGAFVFGLVVRRGSRRRCIAACAIALGLCLVKGALLRYPDIETRLFPSPNYVLFSGWNGPLAMLALGAMAGLVRRRRDWLFLILGGVVTVAYVGDHLVGLASASGLKISPQCESYRCIQTTPYTCGPAAAATMLRAANIATDEQEMARLCLTREDRGTLDLGLYRGLNLKLQQVEAAVTVRLVRLTYDDLFTVPKPCLLRVRFGLDHTVVVLGTTDDGLIVFDPAAPHHDRPWDREMLEEEADWSGYAFVFHRLDGGLLAPGPVRLRYGSGQLAAAVPRPLLSGPAVPAAACGAWVPEASGSVDAAVRRPVRAHGHAGGADVSRPMSPTAASPAPGGRPLRGAPARRSPAIPDL